MVAAPTHNPLQPAHAALLEDSAISQDVANERGYRSVTRTEAQAEDFQGTQALPGLLLPVWNTQGQRVTCQLRPDRPRTFTDDNGKVKTLKYENPKGKGLCLDVHPRVRPVLCDPTKRILITEGIRKNDAVVSAGLPCIGLLGVDVWSKDKKPYADWQHIALDGREVIICFDSDVMCKREVGMALRRLQKFLTTQGAAVRFIYLPDKADGNKQGVDDYLADGHTAADLLALVTDELKPLPFTEHPDAALLQLRRRVLVPRITSGATLRPYGALDYPAGVTIEALKKDARALVAFYGPLDDAKKFDLVSTWLQALRVCDEKKAERIYLNKGDLAQQLFGYMARQVRNWTSELSHIPLSRWRTHLPKWLHVALKGLYVDEQETVLNAFEEAGYMKQSEVEKEVAAMLATHPVEDEDEGEDAVNHEERDTKEKGKGAALPLLPDGPDWLRAHLRDPRWKVVGTVCDAQEVRAHLDAFFHTLLAVEPTHGFQTSENRASQNPTFSSQEVEEEGDREESSSTSPLVPYSSVKTTTTEHVLRDHAEDDLPDEPANATDGTFTPGEDEDTDDEADVTDEREWIGAEAEESEDALPLEPLLEVQVEITWALAQEHQAEAEGRRLYPDEPARVLIKAVTRYYEAPTVQSADDVRDAAAAVRRVLAYAPKETESVPASPEPSPDLRGCLPDLQLSL